MAVIQAGYNCKIDETQKIAVVVSAAGKIYIDTIQQVSVRFEVQSVPVTAQRLIKVMYESYRLKGEGDSDDNYKNGQNGNSDIDGHKAALIGADKPAGQKCYTCGKGGHCARDCPKRQKIDRKRHCFDGICHECGAYGHKKTDYWEFSKNAHKRPHNWVSGNKRAKVASASIEDDMANEIFVANIDLEKLISARGSRKWNSLMKN